MARRTKKNKRQQNKEIPTGRYKDLGVIHGTYKHKFIEYIKELCPEVIEELRQFVPIFNKLFDQGESDYTNTFEDLRSQLVENSFSYNDDFYRHQQIERGNFDTNNFWGKYDSFDSDFYWGEYESFFTFITEIGSNTLLEDEQLNERIKVLIHEQKFNIFSAKLHILEAFEKPSSDKENCVENFLNLQIGIIKWERNTI